MAKKIAKKGQSYDVIIIGAGLSGLTAGLYLQESGLKVLILERGFQAGGLTSSWQVYEQGSKEGKDFVLQDLEKEDLVLQYPMHMIFKEKYPNLLDVYRHLGILKNLTKPLKEFNIIDSRGVKHHFIMEDSILPAPFHAIKTLSGLKMGIVDRLSLLFAGLPMLFLGQSLNRGDNIDSFSGKISMEAFLKKAWVTERGRDFIASLVPSIYNLDSIEVSAKHMSAIIFGTLFMSKNGMHYQLVNDNYTTGTIDPHVKRFIEKGGTIKLNCEVRQIIHDENNVQKIRFQDRGWCYEVICPGCGSKQRVIDEGFCTNCGLKWTGRTPNNIDQPRTEPHPGEKLQEVSAEHYVAAVRGHQLLPLVSMDSHLRTHPYFRNLGREKGARLSIARIFYDRKITAEKFITGTNGREFTFNGCQDISNIMKRYGKYRGSVVDILADRAEDLQVLPLKEFLKLVIKDLERVWPAAKNAEVKLALGAHIQPPVLYHKEVPRLPGERNNSIETPLRNLYGCNCSFGRIGIGMESAYQAGKMVANAILKKEGKQTMHVYGFPSYDISFLSRVIYKFTRALVKTKDFLGRRLTSI